MSAEQHTELGEQFASLVGERDVDGLRERLGQMDPGETARAVSRLSREDQQQLLTLLAPHEGADLLSELPQIQAAELLGTPNERRRNMKKRTLIISNVDRERLESLIDASRMDSRVREDYLAPLEAELGRARIVPVGKVPPDVVTMNSVVRLRDLESDEVEEFELVYPADADMAHNRISVLAPIGTAILGYRLGDIIEWPVPVGVRRFRVEEVLYQPERVGAV